MVRPEFFSRGKSWTLHSDSSSICSEGSALHWIFILIVLLSHVHVDDCSIPGEVPVVKKGFKMLAFFFNSKRLTSNRLMSC